MITPRTAGRALLGLLGVSALGWAAMACGGSSSGTSTSSGGSGVPAGTPATISVTNSSLALLEVSLDGSVLGRVPPATVGTFQVSPRTAALYLREVLEPYLRYYGHKGLVPGARLDVLYHPGVSFNFEVYNGNKVGLHVLVDGYEKAQVPAGEQKDILIDPGRREVVFREEFETKMLPQGFYDFPPPGSLLPEVTILWKP